MISQPRTVIDEFFATVQKFIEVYGWAVVLSVIALYFAKSHIREALTRISLAAANDPKRRKLLDEDVRRVRTYQQLDVYKANREASYAERSDGSQWMKDSSSSSSDKKKKVPAGASISGMNV